MVRQCGLSRRARPGPRDKALVRVARLAYDQLGRSVALPPRRNAVARQLEGVRPRDGPAMRVNSRQVLGMRGRLKAA